MADGVGEWSDPERVTEYVGFDEVDCHFKWLQLTLVVAVQETK